MGLYLFYSLAVITLDSWEDDEINVYVQSTVSTQKPPGLQGRAQKQRTQPRALGPHWTQWGGAIATWGLGGWVWGESTAVGEAYGAAL